MEIFHLKVRRPEDKTKAYTGQNYVLGSLSFVNFFDREGFENQNSMCLYFTRFQPSTTDYCVKYTIVLVTRVTNW